MRCSNVFQSLTRVTLTWVVTWLTHRYVIPIFESPEMSTQTCKDPRIRISTVPPACTCRRM